MFNTITEAVVQAWCVEPNTSKTMDEALAWTIVENINELLYPLYKVIRELFTQIIAESVENLSSGLVQLDEEESISLALSSLKGEVDAEPPVDLEVVRTAFRAGGYHV